MNNSSVPNSGYVNKATLSCYNKVAKWNKKKGLLCTNLYFTDVAFAISLRENVCRDGNESGRNRLW